MLGALSEFAAANFAVLQLGRDLRVHADAVASGALTLAGLAGGQTVVNATATGTMGDDPLPVTQAVNQTTAETAFEVAGDMQGTQALLASAGGTLRLAPLLDSGYGMTATATAAWTLTSNVEALLDTVYDGAWAVVVQALSTVIANVTGASELRLRGNASGQEIASATSSTELRLGGLIAGNQVQLTEAQARLTVQAAVPAQAVNATKADSAWRLSFIPAVQAVQNATSHGALLVQASAVADPYIFSPTIAAGSLRAGGQSTGAALAHSSGTAALRISTRGVGSWANMSVATGALRMDADIERGTNRLNFMPLGYGTANRPFQNRTSNRPSEERDAVST